MLPPPGLSSRCRARSCPRNHARPAGYGILTGRFPILVVRDRGRHAASPAPPTPPTPPTSPASARAAAGPRGGVPRERALPTRRAGGARRAARRRSQRPPSDRRTATRDSQGARVRRLVRVHGSVTPRGGHGGDRQGLGCPTRRTGRGTRLARPLVRQAAGGAARIGSAGSERPPSRATPSPVRAPAAGRPAASPVTETPDATPRGAARARRPSCAAPEARGA